MATVFKADETFRGSFRYGNSETAILRFPFPFGEDSYMYGVNMEPHTRPGSSGAFAVAFDVDEHYVAECAERATALALEPGRCLVLPHMREAEWDTLELVMESLAADYPDQFTLEREGACWTWTNRPLGIHQQFLFGDATTLPHPPFEYITRQAQGDFTLQDQRDGTLYIDGGIATVPADWSLAFDVGMTFHEWHGPVPLAHQAGVFDRALQYLMRVRYGHPARRLNWTMTVNPRLDTSPENYPLWGPDRATITAGNIATQLFLRVELQTFYRLPRSNALLFGIRTYLASLEELTRVPKWGCRLHRVMRDLHPDLIGYKGLSRYHNLLVAYLAQFDDGGPTSSGIAPDIAGLPA